MQRGRTSVILSVLYPLSLFSQERDYIEQYFLSLDPWVPEYQSVRMMRPSLKENWGIKMGYLVR